MALIDILVTAAAVLLCSLVVVLVAIWLVAAILWSLDQLCAQFHSLRGWRKPR
jgi:hypothetical protein